MARAVRAWAVRAWAVPVVVQVVVRLRARSTRRPTRVRSPTPRATRSRSTWRPVRAPSRCPTARFRRWTWVARAVRAWAVQVACPRAVRLRARSTRRPTRVRSPIPVATRSRSTWRPVRAPSSCPTVANSPSSWADPAWVPAPVADAATSRAVHLRAPSTRRPTRVRSPIPVATRSASTSRPARAPSPCPMARRRPSTCGVAPVARVAAVPVVHPKAKSTRRPTPVRSPTPAVR